LLSTTKAAVSATPFASNVRLSIAEARTFRTLAGFRLETEEFVMAHDPQHAGAPLTIQAVQPQQPGGLALASSAIDADGRLDPIYSADGDNVSPELSWTKVLEAQSFALVVEDPDAPRDKPFLHWLIWDIPGAATGLPRGVGRKPLLGEADGLAGAVQGRNDMGEIGWYGMKPPPGHGLHRYHFQLFALGKTLGMGPDTGLMDLLNALRGNTLASAEIVGTYLIPDAHDMTSPARTGSYGADDSRSFSSAAEQEAGRGGLDGDDVDRHAPHTPDGEVGRRGGERHPDA
jgi:Raf kinase inhibitor-like YbhB/YbcL family protein